MSAPLRTRRVAHVFSTFESGGTQRRTAQLLEALSSPLSASGAADFDLEHLIVTLDGGGTDPAQLLPAGVHYRAVSLAKRGSLATTLALRQLFSEERPDVVATYDWGGIDGVFAVRTAKGMRRPCLLHHEDGFTADEQASFKRRRVWARRVALSRADRVVVPSQALAQVAQRLWRVESERIAWIPNGVDTQRFRPRVRRPAWRCALGLDPHVPVIGALGRLSPIKNFGGLLEALAQSRASVPAHLVVAGEGPQRAALEEQAAELGVARRVHFLGFVDEPAELLSEFDLFAFASHREEAPIALLEAMASGLAVVGTRVGDVDRMLPRAQNAYLIDPRSESASAALATAIDALLARPSERQELGRANRECAMQSFRWETTLMRYVQLYTDAFAASESRAKTPA